MYANKEDIKINPNTKLHKSIWIELWITPYMKCHKMECTLHKGPPSCESMTPNKP